MHMHESKFLRFCSMISYMQPVWLLQKLAAAGCLNSAGREKQLAAAGSRAVEHLHGLGNFEGSWIFSLQGGAECRFFEWQAGYVVTLIKGGHVSEENFIDLLLIALMDHEQGFKSLQKSIRDMRDDLKEMKADMFELNDLKKMRDDLKEMKDDLKKMKKETDDIKKSMGDLKVMEKQLPELKGSKTWIWKMAMVFLLLGFIGWFVMGMNEVQETFSQLMLSPQA